MRFLIVLALASTPAYADLEPATAFFGGQYEKKAKVHTVGRAQEVVARTARERLGEKWVVVALNQARRESSFNPAARNRVSGASGVFQVLPSTARGMGFDPSRLFDLEYGSMVGVAYMGKCVEAGVRNDAEMNNCFLRGFYNWRGLQNGSGKSNRKVRRADVR
jgi:hypothetical protein